MSGDHDFRRPPTGRNPQQIELHGKQARILLGPGDVRVDPIDVGVDDLPTTVVIVVELLVQIPPKAEQAGPDVALQFTFTEDLRHGPGRLTSPEFELEESVTGRIPPLGEEEVVLGLGVDVADAPSVHEDLDRFVEAGEIETGGLLAGGSPWRCDRKQTEGADGERENERTSR